MKADSIFFLNVCRYEIFHSYSYLLVLGSTDMGSIGISASARNIAKFTTELVLSTAGQYPTTNSAAAAAAAAAAVVVLGDL